MFELLASILSPIVGKVLSIANEIIKISLEIKEISFCKFCGDDSNSIPQAAMVALIEITNLSSAPYNISEFVLTIGDLDISNTYIKELQKPAARHNALEAVMGDKFRAYFPEYKNSFSSPLWRPYLLTNQSELGIILFRFPAMAEPKNKELKLSVKVSGHATSLTYTLNA